MVKWEDEGENSLMLLTPAELSILPDGIEVECINGKKYTKGKDTIDGDTRGGHLAYGIRRPELLMLIVRYQNEQAEKVQSVVG